MKPFNTYEQLIEQLGELHREKLVNVFSVTEDEFYKLYYMLHKKEHTTAGWASIEFPNSFGVSIFINKDYK